MKILNKKMSDEAWDDEEEELVEKVESTWTYYNVEVIMLSGGKYPTTFQWNFGRDEPSEHAHESAQAFAAQIIGDGTGIWKAKDGDTYIRRETIASVSIRGREKAWESG